MEVFDLKTIKAFPPEEREKNVLFRGEGFKMRIIELPPGGSIPPCRMSDQVIFIVMDGEATVDVNADSVSLKDKLCLVTGPATLSVQAHGGVRMLGIQIARPCRG